MTHSSHTFLPGNGYAVRWVQETKSGRTVKKEKEFATSEARERFMDKLEKHPDFVRFEATANPL